MTIRSIPLFLALTLILVGCGAEPVKEEPKEPPKTPETKIQVNIAVGRLVNPDINGRPSPIVVRLYELKNIGKFEEADFYKLFENHEASLGSDLLATEKFHFRPGDWKALGHTVSPDTKYIAVTAAFRDFNQAVWRDSIAIEPAKTTELSVVLDNLNVSITKMLPK
jgi:type VI secretion system protein VasD